MRSTSWLATMTLAVTFLLILAGGLVHSTGSALACPDWPLCYGSAFPTMQGGVFYEHSHRIIAGSVALLTLVLAALLIRRWQGAARRVGYVAWGAGVIQGALVGRVGMLASQADASVAALFVLTGVFATVVVVLAVWLAKRTGDALPAMGLLLGEIVVVQATLGGITVLLRLPTAVSTAHLAMSMIYFVLLIYLVFRLRSERRAESSFMGRRWIGVAAVVVYLQILLGALVRHTGSGLACNVDILTCNGALLPRSGPEMLLSVHRWMALVVVALVLAVLWGPLRRARRTGDRLTFGLATAAYVLAVVQILLGILTVTTYVAIPVATAHLGAGAALLAALASLFFALGHREGRAEPMKPRAAPMLGAGGATAVGS